MTHVFMALVLIWPMTISVTVKCNGQARTVKLSWIPAPLTPAITRPLAQPLMTSPTSLASVHRDSLVSCQPLTATESRCQILVEESSRFLFPCRSLLYGWLRWVPVDSVSFWRDLCQWIWIIQVLVLQGIHRPFLWVQHWWLCVLSLSEWWNLLW